LHYGDTVNRQRARVCSAKRFYLEAILTAPTDTGNPLDDLAWIKTALWEVYQQNQKLLEANETRYLSVKDLAEKFDCVPATLYHSPWKLPNYGKPDIDSPARWKQSTCEAWYSTPERERREAWEHMGSAERRRKVA
jgi:hypothetical protein